MAKEKAGTTGRAKEKAQKAAFDAVVERQSPEVQKLAQQSRKLVTSVMPDVIETVWTQQGVCSYGTGPKKMSEHFTWLTFSKAHLSFGFYYGSELPDPEGLLEGTGKLMRHVKIRSKADLDRPALRALVEAATRHRVPPLA